MSTLCKAVERWTRLEQSASFPRRCDYCALLFVTDSTVSVIEPVRGNLPLAMHEACARRHRAKA